MSELHLLYISYPVHQYLPYVIFIILVLGIIYLFVEELPRPPRCFPHSWVIIKQVHDPARNITIKYKKCKFCPATTTTTLDEGY